MTNLLRPGHRESFPSAEPALRATDALTLPARALPSGQGEARATTEGIAEQATLGRRLRDLRKSRGKTLDVLANEVGFTKGYLSKLETGRSMPPIATLSRVARALGSDLATLLAGTDGGEAGVRGAVSVVRAHERHQVVRGGTSFGYDYQALAHNASGKLMEPFIFTFPPQILKEVFFEHEGEEMIFVLSGTVEFEVGGVTHELTPGDCVYFDASLRHRGRGKFGEAKALVVICDSGAAHRT